MACLKQALEEATRQLREQEVPELGANIGTPRIRFRENPRTNKSTTRDTPTYTGHTQDIHRPNFMIPLCSSRLSWVCLQAQLSSQAARLTLLEKQVLHWELLGASG